MQVDSLTTELLGKPYIQFSSVAQSCPTLLNPMNRSMPGFPVYHQLPGSIQTHVHRVSDAIHPSHPLLSPSPVQSALCIRWPKYWSFSFNISPSNEHSGLISFQSKGLSRAFSSTTLQKHQFFGSVPSLWSTSHIPILLLQKP